MTLRLLSSPLRGLLAHPTRELPFRPILQTPSQRQIFLRLSLLPAFASLIAIPSLLSDIWDGLLRAVPKKKTSYSKTRSRQLAGKALKNVTALSKCSGCGRVKRMHVLCPYCVQDIREHWKQQAKKAKDMVLETQEASTK